MSTSIRLKVLKKVKFAPCIIITNDIYHARVPVIQVVPITEWNEKKARILTNIEIAPKNENGLTKKSIADCLQTRPVDFRERLVKIRGKLDRSEIERIEEALKIVFSLN